MTDSALDSIIRALQAGMADGKTPFLVALDGGSGAGKSTLAVALAEQLSGVIIQSDDFYAAHIPDAEWDRRTPAEQYAEVIDWQRLRREALEPLLAGHPARWYPFDFFTRYPDGTYTLQTVPVERPPANVIVLDGAYSCRPELHDLIDLRVLVEVPVAVRHERLQGREAADFLAEWHARWDALEVYYFTEVCPPSTFDLVVKG
jgi:uridine kinase